MLLTYMRPMLNNNLGGVVQSWVKITQGYSAKFEFRFESIKTKFSLILSVNRLTLTVLKITEKTIRENAFEQKKKKAGLNLILG